MAVTIVSLETGTWSVNREPVAVRPGTVVEFTSAAAAYYLATATIEVNGATHRRAMTLAEYEAIVADHEGGAAAVDAFGEVAVVPGGDEVEQPAAPAKKPRARK